MFTNERVEDKALLEKKLAERDLRVILMNREVPPVTRMNIVKLYDNLDEGQAFGRTEIMTILDRTISAASAVLNVMRIAGVVERAEDAGRGRYRFRPISELKSMRER